MPARTDFTEEERELARKAQRDYYQLRKEARRASNIRYWLRKAKELEEAKNAKDETATG